MSGTDDVPGWLTGGLLLAVPQQIGEVRDLADGHRVRIASQCARVVAFQSDLLMFGSNRPYGHGERQHRAHVFHGSALAAECGGCEDKGEFRCCMRRFQKKCRVCLLGQPEYSAGEVFDFLARGLAVLACNPGGVAAFGLGWCAAHPDAKFSTYPCPECMAEEIAARAA